MQGPAEELVKADGEPTGRHRSVTDLPPLFWDAYPFFCLFSFFFLLQSLHIIPSIK